MGGNWYGTRIGCGKRDYLGLLIDVILTTKGRKNLNDVFEPASLDSSHFTPVPGQNDEFHLYSHLLSAYLTNSSTTCGALFNAASS
jgi:hypothetical protein